MRSSTRYLAGFAAFAVLMGIGAAGGSAWAQAMGGDVIVNPMAAAPTRLLLYPGGEVARMVPPLLQPGQKTGPVQLHKARRRPVRQASAAPAPETPAPKPAPQKAAEAAPKPQAGGGSASGYVSDFGAAGNLFNGPAMTLTPKSGSSAPQAKPSPPPTQVAKANPPPETSVPGLTRRSVILFAKDAAEPMDSALDQIRFLAGDLNAAMTRESSRIELQAYGGARGDKGSDARRLSLKRALAIRQVLIDDGVSPGRIDVRAMGGADSGPADRVDIYVKA